jgi:hypothetical protein
VASATLDAEEFKDFFGTLIPVHKFGISRGICRDEHLAGLGPRHCDYCLSPGPSELVARNVDD